MQWKSLALYCGKTLFREKVINVLTAKSITHACTKWIKSYTLGTILMVMLIIKCLKKKHCWLACNSEHRCIPTARHVSKWWSYSNHQAPGGKKSCHMSGLTDDFSHFRFVRARSGALSPWCTLRPNTVSDKIHSGCPVSHAVEVRGRSETQMKQEASSLFGVLVCFAARLNTDKCQLVSLCWPITSRVHLLNVW